MTTVGTAQKPSDRWASRLSAFLFLATISTLSVARSDRLPDSDDPASSLSVLTKWSARVREIETEVSHSFNQSTKLSLGWIGSREDSTDQGEPKARARQWYIAIDRAVLRLSPGLVWSVGAEFENERERLGSETDIANTSELSSSLDWTGQSEKWSLGAEFARERSDEADGRIYRSEIVIDVGHAIMDELELSLELKRDNANSRSRALEFEATHFDPLVILGKITNDRDRTVYEIGFRFEF